ncbi:2-dehydropantoate 2-reductase [Mycotypha africana]|uniref:2-dehydropantoate 2-reductase n=1 Tax=Mycotypha africana TaxID=64632 RepID=UPI00230154FE|nr:2-dehydropantoate 2-reductase [Mycotypha africana]KAI8990765.1 2-dehydropantoate 2-reductase [Mycotypha africana]
MTALNAVRPRILTVGTGAIGAIYSWRLSKTSHITAVCRSNYEAVKQNGFDIKSAKFGEGLFRPDEVVRCVSEADTSKTPFDYILVTTKALPECYNVADIIAPAVTRDSTIVLIQNGLGVEEPITERFPNNPIVSIVAYIGTSQVEPGKIVMSGRESLLIGKYLAAKRNSDKEREFLIDLFKRGDVDVQVVDDVERVRWQKLFWNAVFSPICTLTGMNTSQLIKNQEAMSTAKNLMSEVIDAAIANGYDFNHEEQMQMMISRTEATATNYKPSMQLDRERSNPMEVEVILGVPLRRAKAKGLKVPLLEQIYQLCSAANALVLQTNTQKEQSKAVAIEGSHNSGSASNL